MVTPAGPLTLMPRIRALFCVVQYIPDGGRAEAANVGVALFVPDEERVLVRVSPTLARVRKFFAPRPKELKRIRQGLDALKFRLEQAPGGFSTEAEFITFAAARADALRLTSPRVTVTEDPAAKLNALYQQLVGEEVEDRVTMPRSVTFPPPVAEVFGRLRAEGKVWSPGKVRVPETRDKLEIPLAFQNGKVNLVLPQSLAKDAKPESRLPRLGYHGLLIDRHKVGGEDSRLVVMSAHPVPDPEAELRYAEVLDDFQVRFVPFAQAEAFAAEVERTAH